MRNGIEELCWLDNDKQATPKEHRDSQYNLNNLINLNCQSYILNLCGGHSLKTLREESLKIQQACKIAIPRGWGEGDIDSKDKFEEATKYCST